MKKILIHTMTSSMPITHRFVEYLLTNLYYGIGENDEYLFDFHITIWNANHPSLLLRMRDDEIDSNFRGMPKWDKIIGELYHPYIDETNNNSLKILEEEIRKFKLKDNFKKNIQNISYSFEIDNRFSGYSAQEQFLIIDNFILNSKEKYDEYIFVSSNYNFLQKGMVSTFIKNMESYPDIPICQPYTLIFFKENQNKPSINFKHNSLNFFMIRPEKYIKYFKEIENMFKLDKYFKDSYISKIERDRLGLYSNIVSLPGRGYYKDEYDIINRRTDTFSINELNKNTQFMFNGYESCISLYLLYLIDIFKNPEKFNLNTCLINEPIRGNSIEIGNYLLHQMPWKKTRYHFMHQPFLNLYKYSEWTNQLVGTNIKLDSTIIDVREEFLSYKINYINKNLDSNEIESFKLPINNEDFVSIDLINQKKVKNQLRIHINKFKKFLT